MPTMSKITNEYLTLGKYMRRYCFVSIQITNNCLLVSIEYSYVELAKKSEPNKSFLNFTCSETQLNEPYKSFVAMTCSDVSDEKAV
jgi:hypothetical protein